MSCAKTDEPIEMPFGVWILGRAKEPCFMWKPESLKGSGQCEAAFRQFSDHLLTVCYRL